MDNRMNACDGSIEKLEESSELSWDSQRNKDIS